MNNATVTPIKFQDVRGAQLLYLKISVGENQVLINIGQKTFDSVTELINPTGKEKTVTPILEQIQKNIEQKEKVIEESIDTLKKKYKK